MPNSRRRTPAENERDKRLRAKYQSAKPTLEELQKSPEYLPSMGQGDYLAMMGFAASVRAKRQALGLSLSDLASRTGIDRAAICRLENGQVDNPTYQTLERLARALNQRLRLVLEDAPTGAK